MDPTYRALFNESFTPARYERYRTMLAQRCGGPIAFRLAETPVFLPAYLRERLARHARDLVEQLCQAERIAKLERAVPGEVHVPRRDALAHCIQVDFALVKKEDGTFDGRLVELQGFPSLYCFTVLQAEAMSELLSEVKGLEKNWVPFLGGDSREQYVNKLKATILGGHDPREVVLLDLQPEQQKTFSDFHATRTLVGIDWVCPTDLEREGKHLYRRVDGKRVRVSRIFNRVVFDELERKGTKLPFEYTEDLEVSWVPHPNWYWIWSKFTVPTLEHPSVPQARYLSELESIPEDLENYVLKPLFSFAGAGVKVDVTREDLEAVPAERRSGYLLQRKITYAPLFQTPEGAPVKGEIRLMFLRGPEADSKPELVLNLVRLSRGKMLGVDQNKDMDWVGGSVGLFEYGT